MKALTLWPEWAWAILYLGKRWENRPRLPEFYGMRAGDWFCLHAGCSAPTVDRIEALGFMARAAGVTSRVSMVNNDFGRVYGQQRFIYQDQPRRLSVSAPWREPWMPLGAIVAVCKLGVLRHGSDEPWCSENSWNWELAQVLSLGVPVACKGHQGGWNVPPDVLAQVLPQVPQGVQTCFTDPAPRQCGICRNRSEDGCTR